MKYYAPSKLSENIHETPEGFLLCIGVPIARTGEQEYAHGETPLEVGENGTIIITRSEEEVFSEKTIASFEGKAVTIKHPTEFVDPKNWKDLAKGHIQNVRRGDGESKDDLLADILITDAMAISLVKNGLRGLSCGYEAEYTQTGKGKGIQTNIVGNHLALVEEGRAGSTYAITDAKGVKSMAKKTLAERYKAIFSKAIDEAAKEEDAAPEEKSKEEKTGDAEGFDELCKAVKDLSAKIDSMKPKDEKKPEDKGEGEDEEEEGEGKDDDESSIEDRLKTLEVAVAKLLEGKSEDEDEEESEDEDSEVVGDDEEDGDGAEDEASEMTGDTASRAEILAPGIKGKAKDIKALALKRAYGTKDGKSVIDSLTGGKPDFKKSVDVLFIAASEVLKTSRAKALAGDKNKTFDFNKRSSDSGVMTPEKMNEINAKRYNQA